MEDRMIHKSINPYFCLSGLQESQKYGIRGSSTRPVRGGRQTRGCPVANRQTAMPDDGAETEKGISLNFKVSPEFKKEFNGFAVAQGKIGRASCRERGGKYG